MFYLAKTVFSGDAARPLALKKNGIWEAVTGYWEYSAAGCTRVEAGGTLQTFTCLSDVRDELKAMPETLEVNEVLFICEIGKQGLSVVRSFTSVTLDVHSAIFDDCFE